MPEPTPNIPIVETPPGYHNGVQDTKIKGLEKAVDGLKADMNSGFAALGAKLDCLPCTVHATQIMESATMVKTVKQDVNNGFKSLEKNIGNLPCMAHTTEIERFKASARTVYIIAGIIAFFIGVGVSIAAAYIGK